MREPSIQPAPGQESVWDYPRPPRIEATGKRIRVIFGGETIADTTRARRVLETSQPPVYYIPPRDVLMDALTEVDHRTICEFKGMATHWTIHIGGKSAERAAWSYPDPTPEYEALRGYLAFYPARVDACYVDDERAQPQPGGFYGGWITAGVVGPFKGTSGSENW